MVSCLAPVFLALVVGQTAPAEAAWLKSIPADVVAAAHFRSLEAGRDDLMKMIEAMSPNAAALAQPQIEQGLTILSAQYGKTATQHPFLAVAKMPQGAMPAWAILFESTDYQGVLKAIAADDAVKPKSEGGYDSFAKADGQTWYSFKGAGFVAFGDNEDMIKSISKPSASLDGSISAEHKAKLLGGDLGVYVNVAALQTQYADQIEQAKQALQGAIDQAGGQLGGNAAETAKSVYAGMFDAIKVADSFSTNLDFDAAGLAVASFVTVKPDAPVAKSIGNTPAGAGELLAKLPADASAYVFLKLNPDTLAKIQKMSVAMIAGAAKDTTAIDKAIALQQEAGITEMITANNVGGVTTSNVGLSMPKDPKKAVESAAQMLQAMKSTEGMVKDVKLTPNALTFMGFALSEATMTFDLDKMVTPGAPGGVDAVKKMLGGDTVKSWFGTDGKIVVNVSARTADEAKALLTSALSGKGSIGEAPAYAALRKSLPAQANALYMINAQGLLKQVTGQIAAMTGNTIPIPADVPKNAALFGGSMVTSPKGLNLLFVLPSNVGPVIEKGFVPVIQNVGVQVQQ